MSVSFNSLKIPDHGVDSNWLITNLNRLDLESVIQKGQITALIETVVDVKDRCLLSTVVARHYHYYREMKVKDLIHVVPKRTDEIALLQRDVEALPGHWRGVFYGRVYAIAEQEEMLPEEPGDNWGERNAFADLRRARLAFHLMENDRADFRTQMKRKLHSGDVPDSAMFRAVWESFGRFLEKYPEIWAAMSEFEQDVLIKNWREKLYFITTCPELAETSLDLKCFLNVTEEIVKGNYLAEEAKRIVEIALHMARQHPEPSEIQHEIWYRLLVTMAKKREEAGSFWPFESHEGSKQISFLGVNSEERDRLRSLNGCQLEVHVGSSEGVVARFKKIDSPSRRREELASRCGQVTGFGLVPFTRETSIKEAQGLYKRLLDIRDKLAGEKNFDPNGNAAQLFADLPGHVKDQIYREMDELECRGVFSENGEEAFWGTRLKLTGPRCAAINAYITNAKLACPSSKDGTLQQWIPNAHPAWRQLCNGYGNDIERWVKSLSKLELLLYGLTQMFLGEEDSHLGNTIIREGDRRLYAFDNDRCLQDTRILSHPKMWSVGTSHAYSPYPVALLHLIVHDKWRKGIEAVNRWKGSEQRTSGYGVDSSYLEAQMGRISQIQELAKRGLTTPGYSLTLRQLFFEFYGVLDLYQRVKEDTREHDVIIFDRMLRREL